MTKTKAICAGITMIIMAFALTMYVRAESTTTTVTTSEIQFDTAHTAVDIFAQAMEGLAVVGSGLATFFAWMSRKRGQRIDKLVKTAKEAGSVEATERGDREQEREDRLTQKIVDLRAETERANRRVRDDVEDDLEGVQNAFLQALDQHRQEMARTSHATLEALRVVTSDVRQMRSDYDLGLTRVHDRVDEVMYYLTTGHTRPRRPRPRAIPSIAAPEKPPEEEPAAESERRLTPRD